MNDQDTVFEPENTPENNLTETQSLRERRKGIYRKIVLAAWACVCFGFISVIALFWSLSLNLPDSTILENPESYVATEVLDINGELIGRYFIENRIPVRYEHLSPHLINALISTEDERYRNHSGIDFRALVRVISKTILGGDMSAGGGSTISQQLAKLLFGREDLTGLSPMKRKWILATTKFREWLTAIKLERCYTKDEIIAMYLNQFDFINGAYGIKAASEIYFSSSPDSLKVEEAALLIGMLKNPSLFNPMRFEEKAQNRRNVVFFQMKRAGHIPESQYDSLKALPIDLSGFKRPSHDKGLAPYFREELRKEVKKILANYKKPDGSTYDVHQDGLRIWTTLDVRMQRLAEESALSHMKTLQGHFFKHWDPKHQKKDPWEHKGDASSGEMEKRKNSLLRVARESNRYQELRKRHMLKCMEMSVRDVDIDRMKLIQETTTKKIDDKWLKSKYISNAQYERYLDILASDDWADIEKEFNDFDIVWRKDFDEKKEMQVFAYNDNFEADTIMSPWDSLKYHRMILQTGVLVLDPYTGHIKAWVGGVNYKYFKYDHANKTVARQIGSTIKPFLYAFTIDQRGFSPCHSFYDAPVCIPKATPEEIENGTGFGLLKDWCPKNAGGYEYETMSLYKALHNSVNSISVKLMRELGSTNKFRGFLDLVGIDTSRVPASPSICLGAADISVYEMAGAYTAFVNKGVYTEPVFIRKIEDKNGGKIYEPVQKQGQVMEVDAFYAMQSLLQYAVRGAGGFSGIKSDYGGKTGTTNSHADGWFMGITNQYIVATWVGGDDRWIRFRSMQYGQGARMARPIFQNLLRAIEQDSVIYDPKLYDFESPKGDLKIELDCSRYRQSDGGGLEQPPGDGLETPESDFNDGGLGDEELGGGLDD